MGAGQTQLAGDYQQTVYEGLLYLLKQIDGEGNTADLGTGTDEVRSFAHAVATLALCEAYALARERRADAPEEEPPSRKSRLLRAFETKLAAAAQLGVNHIVQQQAKTGGWRSDPTSPVSMEATMAAVLVLRAAWGAGLQVPTTTLRGANRFLDSLAVDGGERYRPAADEEPTALSSAAGLLTRTS